MTDDYGRQVRQQRDKARAQLAAVEAERDGAYRERAQLLAWLAALHPAVLTPAPDVDEPGWQILYLDAAGHQLSWHIHPRDADLYGHVEQVPADDPRAQWDGHTTAEKYQRIAGLAADPVRLSAVAALREGRDPYEDEAVVHAVEAAWTCMVGSHGQRIQAEQQRAVQAEARITAVRALHQRRTTQYSDTCDECYDRDYPEPWPCPTITALDGAAVDAGPDPALVAAEEALTRVLRLAETLPPEARAQICAAIDRAAEQPADGPS